jgi:hypothetical protein
MGGVGATHCLFSCVERCVMPNPVTPNCPRCLEPAEYKGHLLDLRGGTEIVFLRCDCGWNGTADPAGLHSGDEVLMQRRYARK